MDACNIESRGITQRRGLGGVMLVLAVAGGVWMITAGWGAVWRIALFPAFWLAALALLQAREKV